MSDFPGAGERDDTFSQESLATQYMPIYIITSQYNTFLSNTTPRDSLTSPQLTNTIQRKSTLFNTFQCNTTLPNTE